MRSESQEALHLIQNDILDLRKDWSLIVEVKEMLRHDWLVKMDYIERDLNSRANLLAKLALNDYPGLTIMASDTLAGSLQPAQLREEDFLLDNAYYSEMRDAGFFDADWE